MCAEIAKIVGFAAYNSANFADRNIANIAQLGRKAQLA